MNNEELSRSTKIRKRQAPESYTVTELTRIIKGRVEDIGRVWLRGEISNLKCHSSGHVYLTLKDSDNQINAIIWRYNSKNQEIELKDGLEVLVSGDLTIYGPQSKYQVTIETIEPQGTGLLLIAFENLKKKLAAAGLFDRRHKKPLPLLPRKICLVTSPTGAAVQDILNVISRRFPRVTVLIYPVRVQGDGAAQEIAEAIAVINHHADLADVDVIITGRGGGSLEDLWAFNEEIVVQAIFASRIPIISAVGHEIDVTIADLVADRRALTPSEAGELVVPRLDQVYQDLQAKGRQLQMASYNRLQLARSNLDRLATHRALFRPLDRVRQLQQKTDGYWQRLHTTLERQLHRRRICLSQLSNLLQLQRPLTRVERDRQHLDHLRHRLFRAMQKRVEWELRRLNNYQSHLQALSPLAVLRRGYSITYVHSGESVVRHHRQVKPGDLIWTRMANSWILSQVVTTGSKGEK